MYWVSEIDDSLIYVGRAVISGAHEIRGESVLGMAEPDSDLLDGHCLLVVEFQLNRLVIFPHQ